jgi:glycosyltransferase involved in cell wall biosynthesis
MTAHTRVTVVIPCYNGAPFISETVASAIGQTHKPIEIIVVDDGSTDDSAAIAESFGPPVRVIRQANQGESVARNRGIDSAIGDWVAFLDADDLWVPHKLEQQLKAIDERTLAVCSEHYVLPPKARPPYCGIMKPQAKFFQIAEIIRNGGTGCIPSTLMVRRSSAVRFPAWARFGEDTVYLLDLCQTGKIAVVHEYLAFYRISPGAQSLHAGAESMRYAALEQWIETNRFSMTTEEAVCLHRNLDEQLLERARQFVHKRAWPKLESVQELVRNRPSYPFRREVLALPKFPRFLYSLRDGLRTIWQALGGNGVK